MSERIIDISYKKPEYRQPIQESNQYIRVNDQLNMDLAATRSSQQNYHNDEPYLDIDMTTIQVAKDIMEK